jgi:hypothetical protein
LGKLKRVNVTDGTMLIKRPNVRDLDLDRVAVRLGTEPREANCFGAAIVLEYEINDHATGGFSNETLGILNRNDARWTGRVFPGWVV